ncbi:AraC-type DNA-binding protein [Paenibacillus sp. UNCCL117]|uniref:AraC family transcriptional regulator n=1 Tax=unclassified Paenibacillus TaxID=185978 RepID=UPI000890DFDE|nr:MULTISPECIES: AraC family transcriptional regulator [unclassified Paenibacillus]SDD64834.1 AraC-type DNA-binding protein [Paenibacillus sp. cl123]SFW58243.1 AraC-type DNA-binding protein [Paenibacillus sp. UNCCL117]
MGVLTFRSKGNLMEEIPFSLVRHHSNHLKQQLHTHEYIQIAYVLRGTCNHQFRNKSLTVGRGDLFIISPGVEHSLNSIEDKEFELILLDFLPLLVHEQVAAFSESLWRYVQHAEPAEALQPWLHIGKSKQPLVEQLIQDIQDELDLREPGFDFSIRINLIKLLILIDREYRRTMRRPSARTAFGEAEESPIQDVVRYIYDNYSQDIPLEQGAHIARMAPAYFCSMFKKETGQTFVDFLHEVRIERAMELIRQDTHTVTQICFQVGFHHLSHFIRTFKKRTGLTPTEYKKTFGNT